MFGKLFNFKKTPKNDGNPEEFEDIDGERVKVFDIELVNMEGSPTYRLTHQLSVGSEIGNIVVADESISPRHATFVLQQNVISLIDHASVGGTFVNDKQIPSGKYIILDEADEIKVGELVLKIKPSYEVVPSEVENVTLDAEEESVQDESSDEAREESVEEEVVEEEEIEEEEDLEEEREIKPSKIKNMFQKLKNKFSFKKKAPKAKINMGVVATAYSANALVRVVAVTMDLLFSYGLMIILLPFDDFKNLLKLIPEEIDELLGVKLSEIWLAITSDFEVVREITADILSSIEGVVQIWPLMFLFFSIRLISTLIFGVSFSEYLVGMKAGGNGIWARIGGPVRVILGMLTWPFVVFDVPAIVSRKTFKEFITFTRVELRSKLFGVLGTLLFLPCALGFVLLAPLFQGFEPPESILVSDLVERRVKVQKPVEESPSEVVTDESIPVEVVQSSKFLNLELSYKPDQLMLAPQVNFKGVGKKLSFTTSTDFFLKDMQRLVNLSVLKKFNFQKFLSVGMKGNFFLYEKFPEIYGLVYRPDGEVSKSMGVENDQTREAFTKEFISFFKLSMEISLDNFMDVMENQTPLLQSLIEFKSSFLDLVDSKNFHEIGFLKLGNLTFLKVSYNSQAPYDLLIPIEKSEGRVYRVEFDGKENLKDLASKFYKYHLEKANWQEPKVVEKSDSPNTFQIIDSLASIEDIKKDFDLNKAQMLFSYFYQASGIVLQSQMQGEQEVWKKSLTSISKLVETLTPVNQNTEEAVEEDPIVKLKENFTNLVSAFENKNFEYFGISAVESTDQNL